MHTDLQAAGLIPDPFYGTNEESLQWIELEDWEYRTTFIASEELLSRERIDLIFEGLDTYASVYLNDSLVLESDNMFREWRIDCNGLIRSGENELLVLFRSPVREVEQIWGALGYELPGGPRVLTRKAAYNYGWDWAPRFVTSGIWRPARLEAWSGSRIDNMRIIQRGIFEREATLTAAIEIESTEMRNVYIDLYLYKPEHDGFKDISKTSRWLPKGRTTMEIDFELFQPGLWWPNGMGDQNLYTIVARLRDPALIDEARETIGLRTLELVTKPDSIGESFYFRVNGVPVFAKGANWIPMDSFTPRIGRERYERILKDAADSGSNMLRVWGGGIYEEDIFYDLCDSLGILVWQDFMFACAMYPGDEGFLRNVEMEAAQNVRRLRNHPCIALWCGNNESDEGWRNWGWQKQYGYSPEDSVRIWKDYEALFHELLPRVVTEHDGTREYRPSSPEYGRADPRSMTEGDSHYWGVWHDAEPFEIFSERIPRFMSEFGFQSFPSMSTIQSFAAPEDRLRDSEVMLSHQKHPRGNELIAEYMERWYRPPKDFESFVYLSQLLQAEGIGYAIEAHRRAKPYCMGTLYWQLDDCWPVASWSSIDYHGNWKALQYRVKSAYSDPLISPFARDGRLEISIVTDGREPAVGAVGLSLLRFDGELVWRREIGFGIDPEKSTVCFDEPIEDLLSGNDPRSAVLEIELAIEEEVVANKLFYFVPPKELALEKPKIRVETERTDKGYDILFSTDTFAKNVYITAEGTLNDNYFDLLPGRTKRVSFVPRTDEHDPVGKIEIISLYDTYEEVVK